MRQIPDLFLLVKNGIYSGIECLMQFTMPFFFIRGARRFALQQLRDARELADVELLCRGFLTQKDDVIQRLAIIECEQRRLVRLKNELWVIASDESREDNRLYALRCLGNLGDQRIVDVCSSMLSNGNVAERCIAATALGGTRNDATQELLQTSMSADTNADVRLMSAISLARLGSGEAVSQLERWMDSSRGIMRARIAGVLASTSSAAGKEAASKIASFGSPKERAFLQRSYFRCDEIGTS